MARCLLEYLQRVMIKEKDQLPTTLVIALPNPYGHHAMLPRISLLNAVTFDSESLRLALASRTISSL
jgi:hypothetical protein